MLEDSRALVAASVRASSRVAKVAASYRHSRVNAARKKGSA